jgi:hypothetical protein
MQASPMAASKDGSILNVGFPAAGIRRSAHGLSARFSTTVIGISDRAVSPMPHNVQRFSFGGAVAQAGPRGFRSWDPRR